MRKWSLRQALIILAALIFCLPTAPLGDDRPVEPCAKDGIVETSRQSDGAPCVEAAGESVKSEKRTKDVPDKKKNEKASGPADIFERLMAEDPLLAATPPLKPFGQAVFSGSELSAPESLPINPDYPIGYGDEIGVTFWGRVTGEHILKVTREGTISLPMIGPLNVNGMTFKEAGELISSKARSIIGAEVSVTMGRLRSIQVFVLGEVSRPGSYKMSAASTVSSALMSAGGAAPIGSLRKVELRRGTEKPRQIDFYDLLLKGDKSRDARLNDGDVVFVPVIGPVIGIAGNIKRPAAYEIKGPTSLLEAIELSGGVIPTAYTQQVQVERIENNSRRVVADINAGDTAKAGSFMLRDGDFVKVLSITGKDTNAVYLYGNVKRPGKYELKPGMKLSGIITGFSDLLEETHLTYGVIKRLTPELNTMVIPFNVGALLSGSEPDDLKLMPLDSVFVFSTWLFRDRPTVSIEGEVRTPGQFTIEENLTVKDLILLAGGLTTEASYGEYELYRKDELTQKTSLLRLNLGKALQGVPSENPVLRSSDVVRVHSALEAEPQKTVSVLGQVNRPGEYGYASNMRVSDLVFAGGGLKESAYLKEAELASYEVEDKTTSSLSYRTLDLEKALEGDPEHNLQIKPYDSLFVREVIDWLDRRYIELSGEVRFPGKYVFKKGEKLSSVITRAGDFTNEAYLNGAVFTRESVRELQQTTLEEAVSRLEARLLNDASAQALTSTGTDDVKQMETALSLKKELLARVKAVKAQGRIALKFDELNRFSGSSYDVALEHGDRLFVPVRPTQVQIMGAVQNPAAFIFEQEAAIKNYISKAGGYSVDADEGRVFVLKSDGTALSRNSSWPSGFGFTRSTLDPGDTIVVPEKIDKGLWLREVKDITQILYQIAVTAGVLIVAF
ncbi:MAG: SLBB domain-containing protein [Deltaproteobacteria bacterium]|nr:SLBB domain-containing protein [Deltaproteobacteria bacterium]